MFTYRHVTKKKKKGRNANAPKQKHDVCKWVFFRVTIGCHVSKYINSINSDWPAISDYRKN